MTLKRINCQKMRINCFFSFINLFIIMIKMFFIMAFLMIYIVCFFYHYGIVHLLCQEILCFYILSHLMISIFYYCIFNSLILNPIHYYLYQSLIFIIFLAKIAMDLLMSLMIIFISRWFISTFGSSTYQIFLYYFLISSFIYHFQFI